MIHQKTGFHHLLRFIRRWALYLLPVFTIACNHSNYDTLPREGAINLLGRINQLRAGQDLVPLQMDDALNGTATARAWKVASGGPDEPDEATLKRMTDAGIFARFALSCVTRGESVEAAMNRVFDDPLSASRVSHGGVTHIGMNIARSGGTIVLVLDMARLVPAADPETITGKLIEDIRTRRERIGVAPLAMDNTLNDAAVQLVSDFMNRADTSDSLIAKAQASLASNNFNLGKITVAFQVVGIPGDIVVPERTSDPGAAAMGISVRQGNHPDHDPGAVAVAIFLASPQTSTTATPKKNATPPRAMPGGHRPAANASPEEQAWIATLAGNHKKAAALFSDAYQKTKNPEMLYEQARALARDGKMDRSLAVMKEYAAVAAPENRDKAQGMIARLEAGESIFSTSRDEQMSVEARRFFVLGQKLFNASQWEGAIDAFEQAYAYAPHPDLIYNMGLAHLRAGNVGEALDFFQEYQRQVPEAGSVEQAKQLFQMGVELYAVGQYDAAARRFALAYTFMPIPEVLFNLALCHSAMGDRAEALRILRELADKTTAEADKKEIRRLIRELEQ